MLYIVFVYAYIRFRLCLCLLLFMPNNFPIGRGRRTDDFGEQAGEVGRLLKPQ